MEYRLPRPTSLPGESFDSLYNTFKVSGPHWISERNKA